MLSDDRQLIETPISDETVFRGALIDVSHMQVRLPNGRSFTTRERQPSFL